MHSRNFCGGAFFMKKTFPLSGFIDICLDKNNNFYLLPFNF